MGILNIFKRKKTDGEAQRRATLLRSGRITEGSIIDAISDDEGTITQVFYSYEINGVEYESSQSLDPEQQHRSGDYFPGSRVTVRFNPHQPGNSVVA